MLLGTSRGKSLPIGRLFALLALAATAALLTLFWSGHSTAGSSQVVVLSDSSASAIERFAADELRRYLQLLFHVEASDSLEEASTESSVFVVGSGASGAVLSGKVAAASLKLSSQGLAGFAADWNGHRAFVISGGSPQATLWAVYELVERWGVRYLLHGDVLPEPRDFSFPPQGFVMEPALPVRQWRVVNEFACGPASWGIDDYQPVIDQLAKLKFNRLFVYIWQHGPFLKYQFGGIERRSSDLFFGARFPIQPGAPGAWLFGDAKQFENPDIPFTLTGEDRLNAGIQHVRKVIAYGEQRGMATVISATLTEFPPEFAPLLGNAEPIRQVGSLTITPGSETRYDDPKLTGLAKAVLRATVDTYPEATRIVLSMPEHRQWIASYQEAWQHFRNHYQVGGEAVLAEMLKKASVRPGWHSSVERAQAEVKGDLVGLLFYDRLIRDPSTLAGTANPNVPFAFDGIAEELFPILNRILPPRSELLNFIDYTPARVLERAETLDRVPAKEIPSVMIYTLHDDNVGLLPQLATQSLHRLTRKLLAGGWDGFSTRYWLIGDQDPAVAYLSKAGWSRVSTPDAVYRDQLQAVCGEGCVAPAMEALAALEKATLAQEKHGLGFAFPVEGMLMKHWRTNPIAPEMLAVRQDYKTALTAIQAARKRGSADKSGYLAYLEGRLVFGIGYLDATEYVSKGGTAEAAGDFKAARDYAQRATDRLREAVASYAKVARDASDRGAIAMLLDLAFRPIAEKSKMLAGTVDGKAKATNENPR